MATVSDHQEALKKVLKARKVSYSELAKTLGLSLSAVHRIINGRDLSTARLLEILGVIGMRAADFYATLPEERPRERASLSPAQEKALRSDFKVFAVYWKLAVERLSLAEIKKEGNFTDRELKRIEEAMAKYGLDPAKPPVELQGEGPLMTEIREEWPERILRNARKENQAQPWMAQLRVSEQSAAEVAEKLGELQRFIKEVAERKNLGPRDQFRLMTIMTVLTTGSVIADYRRV